MKLHVNEKTFLAIIAFIFLWGLKCNAQNITPTDTVYYDTVYYAPDTIKSVQIDTVYEYIEDEPVLPKKNKPKVKLNLKSWTGIYSGIVLSNLKGVVDTNLIAFPGLYLGTGVASKLFYISAGFGYQNRIAFQNSINKKYTIINTTIDTIERVIDEYYEIIDGDTIKRQVIERTYISRSDTLHTDSVFKYKNYYSEMHIPIIFGMKFNSKKTIAGFGIGIDVSILKSNNNNKVIGENDTYIEEKPFFRSVAYGIISEMFIRRKLNKHLWANLNLRTSIPLQSNYGSYKSDLFISRTMLYAGLEYFFNK